MDKLNLIEDDKVTLANTTGKMENLSVKKFDVRKGNIMAYFPEANCLIAKDTDSRSKTPGFKSAVVQVICQ